LASLLRCIGNIRLSKAEPVTPLWLELRRYLDYDQVIPSYHNLITQAVLESLCKLEVTQQMERKIQYEEFVKPRHFWGVRLTAFKCMVTLAPVYPEIALKLLHLIRHEHLPGLRFSMARAWGDSFTKLSLGAGPQRGPSEEEGMGSSGLGVGGLSSSDVYISWSSWVSSSMPSSLSLPLPPSALSLDKFRTNTPTNKLFMDRLWISMCESDDNCVRMCLYRVYKALWGRGSPACASADQKECGARLWQQYPMSKSTTRAVTLAQDFGELSKSTKRRLRAKKELRQQRAQRAWESRPIETAVKLRIKKKGKFFKASESESFVDEDDGDIEL